MSKLKVVVLLLSFMFTVWVACGEDPVGTDPNTELVEDSLKNAKILWQENGDSTYIIEQSVGCFSPIVLLHGLVRLSVENDSIVKGVRTDDNFELEQSELGLYRTIPELFNVIANAENADILDVTYDSLYGYPLHIFVNPHLDCYDEERSYRTRLIQADN